VLALGVDTADQISQRHTAACSYILQSSPEYILKADTRLVAPNDDGALDLMISWPLSPKPFPKVRGGLPRIIIIILHESFSRVQQSMPRGV
jgi:hypothetical protein